MIVRRLIPLTLLVLVGLTFGRPATAGVDLTTFWVLPDATIYRFGGCELKPVDAPRDVLAAGLRVRGWIVEDRCGVSYVRLSLPMMYVGSNAAIVAVDRVSTRPPRRDPWKGADVTGTAWVHDAGRRWGVPLSDPEWLSPVPLRGGETIGLIDAERGIVRTVGGHIVAVSPNAIVHEDPTIDRDAARRKEARIRWEAGREARERRAALSGVPPSETLAAHAEAWRGRGYLLEFDHLEATDEAFEPAWLDPVEQVLRHACHEEPRRRKDGEPCGTYLLDYRALGSWWPSRDVVVLAEADGLAEVDGAMVPRLRVLVIQPQKIGSNVSVEWAEGR